MKDSRRPAIPGPDWTLAIISTRSMLKRFIGLIDAGVKPEVLKEIMRQALEKLPEEE